MKYTMDLMNKKILVTGASGFIGSHLVEQLVKEGAKVKAFVHYNSRNSYGWLDDLQKDLLDHVEIIWGDIRNQDSMKRSVSGVDIIYHLAALIGIPYSYHSPESYIDTNIKGTWNILHLCRGLPIERIVVISSSEVYGSAQYVPIDENHPLQGQSPYSASKIGSEKMAESFYLSFNMPITIVRPFNTYGPRQSARAVIPTIIMQTLSEASEIKLGSLSPSRDFNYVKDTCQAFIEIVKSEKTIGKTLNICSGKDISIGNLVETILKITNSKKSVVCDSERIRPEKSEVQRLCGNNHFILNLTQWQPKFPIEIGLREVIAWLEKKENIKSYRPGVYYT